MCQILRSKSLLCCMKCKFSNGSLSILSVTKWRNICMTLSSSNTRSWYKALLIYFNLYPHSMKIKYLYSLCFVIMLVLIGCGSHKDVDGVLSLTWEKVEVSASVNTGLESDSTTREVTIQKAKISQQWQMNVSFTELWPIDTMQMANIVGFYDIAWTQLNYSWKQESSFSCKDQSKREKKNCSWYLFKYKPFSFSFLSTKDAPSAEVASGELLLRTKNYTITVKKYEYSDLKLFERDIQREFVSIRKERPRQCMVWKLKPPILFVSPKEKVKTELIRLLQALKASQGLKCSVGPGD